jgi:CheY-like chemotaxis protein
VAKTVYTVLFVDDEESILKITKILLSSLDVKVILSNSGKKAINILSDKEYKNEIDLVLLDLTMPKMNGLEVLKWLNNKKIAIPVILQTGIEDESELSKAFKLGIKDYLVKPYTKEKLYEFIVKYARLK